MKKVLLPLAFLGMTMAATSVALADDAQGDHHKIFNPCGLIINNQRMFWYLLWDAKNCKDIDDGVKVKGDGHKHIKVCNKKPFHVRVCFSDERLNGDGHDHECTSKPTDCTPNNNSPSHVIVLGKWSPALSGDNDGPKLFCFGKQDHDHDNN